VQPTSTRRREVIRITWCWSWRHHGGPSQSGRDV